MKRKEEANIRGRGSQRTDPALVSLRMRLCSRRGGWVLLVGRSPSSPNACGADDFPVVSVKSTALSVYMCLYICIFFHHHHLVFSFSFFASAASASASASALFTKPNRKRL
uniref:Transmembrane protein n=1 Tax=Manihot esculenta TaxID=3983 RepID=A0A2C9UL76_MANES